MEKKITQKSAVVGFYCQEEGQEKFILSQKAGLNTTIVLFDPHKKTISHSLEIIGEKSLDKFSDFRIYNVTSKKFILSYKKGKKICFAQGSSNDLTKWETAGELVGFEHTLLMPNPTAKNNYLVFCGDEELKVALTEDFEVWKLSKNPVLGPRKGYFDEEDIRPIAASATSKGILLLYFCEQTRSLGAALFDSQKPTRLIWRSADPVWVFAEKISPMGGFINHEQITFYYKKNDNAVYRLKFNFSKIFGQKGPVPLLQRFEDNPVISPNPANDWESLYTFNAAILYEKKKFHFIYRAIGETGISVLGYAASRNGFFVDERLKQPVFGPLNASKSPNTAVRASMYASGDGWGGCEDPRLTKIDDKVYMTYTLLDERTIPQVALTSISLKNFLDKNWKWSRPIIISPDNEVHKNWVLFPAKIKGKYAIMHSISPEIMIEYLDALDFPDKRRINSKYVPHTRAREWDTRIRGVGSPPIQTDLGWLIFYHAIDQREPSKYKLGAMILDRNEPEKILYRSVGPILEPDFDYENNGFKPGIVYNCGAVAVGEILYVYYGAADTVVCLATAKLKDFLGKLKASMPTKIENVFSTTLITKANV